MVHDGGGVFDALDVFVDMNVLIRREQVAAGIGEPGQHAGDPDMFQDRALGRDAVDNGRLAIDLVRGGDDRDRDVLTRTDLVGVFGARLALDLDTVEALFLEMVAQLHDGLCGRDIGDQANDDGSPGWVESIPECSVLEQFPNDDAFHVKHGR